MTIGQVVEIGPFSFQFFRLLLAIGLIRVVLKGERIEGPLNAIDKLVILWATWVFLASFFHRVAPGSGPVFALGLIYNVTLIYFLLRIWCRNESELRSMIGVIATLLVPVALAMWIEKLSLENPFAVFGGVPDAPTIREGLVRAQGPFAHPILAGTVGATCLPLMLSIWSTSRARAIYGSLACLAMVVASASSGPLMSLLLGLLAIGMWPFRRLTKLILPMSILAYVGLSIVMSRPPYYILNYIDLTGGSTGWHRANLIENFLTHFSEWWMFGTDKTQHWMPNAHGPTPDHTDITNFFISFAIVGGLVALVLIVLILWKAFRWVGIASGTRSSADAAQSSFTAWCLGSALFAHAATSISVAYFDQSMIFFWTTISVISSLHSLSAGRSELDSRQLLSGNRSNRAATSSASVPAFGARPIKRDHAAQRAR